MSYRKGMVNKERLTNLLIDLCKTDSASRNERLMADKVKGMLTELGFVLHEDDAAAKLGGNTGNLYARLEGTAPGEPILFCAHLDRVTPGLGIQPRIENGALVSDGSTILGSDDAAGLSAILEAVRVVKEQNLPHPTVELCLTVCEELGMLGSRQVDTSWFQSKIGFALDADQPVGEITIKAPNKATFTATFHGKASHAGLAPEKGISAIQMAGVALSRMKLLRIDEETTANIGTISAEGRINIVPGTCTIAGEARSLDEDKLQAQVAGMREAMESAAREFGGKVEIDLVWANTGLHLGPESPSVARAARAAKLIGVEPKFVSVGGCSDASILSRMGLETTVLSMGFEEVHSVRERMPLDQLEAVTEWALAIIAG